MLSQVSEKTSQVIDSVSFRSLLTGLVVGALAGAGVSRISQLTLFQKLAVVSAAGTGGALVAFLAQKTLKSISRPREADEPRPIPGQDPVVSAEANAPSSTSESESSPSSARQTSSTSEAPSTPSSASSSSYTSGSSYTEEESSSDASESESSSASERPSSSTSNSQSSSISEKPSSSTREASSSSSSEQPSSRFIEVEYTDDDLPAFDSLAPIGGVQDGGLLSGRYELKNGGYLKGLQLPVENWPTDDEIEANQEAWEALYAGSTNARATYIPKEVASRVELHGRSYVAMKAPLRKNLARGWEAMWQENVTTFVNLRESSEDRPDYWASGEHGFKNSDLRVKLESVEHFECEGACENALGVPYIVRRTFTVTRGDEQREVTQWHLRNWPDHTVPDGAAIRKLLDLTAESEGPIGVHCRAGVGRTGSFILLDGIRRQIEEGAETVDPFHDRAILNAYRWLVQHEGQFMEVIKIARHYAEGQGAEESGARFSSIYPMTGQQAEEAFRNFDFQNANRDIQVVGFLRKENADSPLELCRVFCDENYIHRYHPGSDLQVGQIYLYEIAPGDEESAYRMLHAPGWRQAYCEQTDEGKYEIVEVREAALTPTARPEANIPVAADIYALTREEAKEIVGRVAADPEAYSLPPEVQTIGLLVKGDADHPVQMAFLIRSQEYIDRWYKDIDNKPTVGQACMAWYPTVDEAREKLSWAGWAQVFCSEAPDGHWHIDRIGDTPGPKAEAGEVKPPVEQTEGAPEPEGHVHNMTRADAHAVLQDIYNNRDKYQLPEGTRVIALQRNGDKNYPFKYSYLFLDQEHIDTSYRKHPSDKPKVGVAKSGGEADEAEVLKKFEWKSWARVACSPAPDGSWQVDRIGNVANPKVKEEEAEVKVEDVEAQPQETPQPEPKAEKVKPPVKQTEAEPQPEGHVHNMTRADAHAVLQDIYNNRDKYELSEETHVIALQRNGDKNYPFKYSFLFLDQDHIDTNYPDNPADKPVVGAAGSGGEADEADVLKRFGWNGWAPVTCSLAPDGSWQVDRIGDVVVRKAQQEVKAEEKEEAVQGYEDLDWSLRKQDENKTYNLQHGGYLIHGMAHAKSGDVLQAIYDELQAKGKVLQEKSVGYAFLRDEGKGLRLVFLDLTNDEPEVQHDNRSADETRSALTNSRKWHMIRFAEEEGVMSIADIVDARTAISNNTQLGREVFNL